MTSRGSTTRFAALILMALALASVAPASAQESPLKVPADVDLRADADEEEDEVLVAGTRLVTLAVRYCHAPAAGAVDGEAVVHLAVDAAPAWTSARIVPDRVEFPLETDRTCSRFVDVTLVLATRPGVTPVNATGNITVLARADPGAVNAAAEDALLLAVRSPTREEDPGPGAGASTASVDLVPQAARDTLAGADAFTLATLGLAGALLGAGVAAWWTRP